MAGLFSGTFFAENRHGDLYARAVSSPSIYAEGTLDFADRKRNRLVLKSGARRLTLQCDASTIASYCAYKVPHLPLQTKVQYFVYGKYNIITEIRLKSGDIFASTEERMRQIKSVSATYSRMTSPVLFIYGFFGALIIVMICKIMAFIVNKITSE